ncbi:hypothetical protein [Bradyrhizobium sp. RDM4]|uniref:hypothetical protein n=1 Tax=Bradyrhizobium sp. RDM4 TaxID=3378765 RepID=UPI0038FD386C
MGDVEKLVRVSRGGITPPQRVVASGQTDKPNVVLVIGKDSGGDGGASVKTLSKSFSYSLTTYMDKQERDTNVAAPEPEPSPDPGAPKGRESHVKQIPAKTRDAAGNVVDEPSSWIDVRRIQKNQVVQGSGKDYQKTTQKLKWYEDVEGLIGNRDWKFTPIKIIPPDEDPDNPQLWFEVDVVDEYTVIDNDQRIARKFDNADENRRRKVTPRRVTHFDTPADDDPAYANGGIIKDYKKTKGTEDQDQYLDYEVVGKFARVDNDQRTIVSLQNDYLVKQTREPDQDYGGAINPPWRLDPLQNIVNVTIARGSPKYAAAYGFTGAATVMMFSLDDNGALSVVKLDDPIDYEGYVQTVSGADDIPSPLTSAAIAVAADWKGVFSLSSGPPLVLLDDPVGAASAAPDKTGLVDYTGKEVAAPAETPVKGLLRNGLWVTSQSVAKYNGDSLVWQRSFNSVYEVLSGLRVLGDNYPAPGYGLHTLSPEDGSTISFTGIGSRGLDNSMGWDTASDGTSYVGFPSIETAGDSSLVSMTIGAIDRDNKRLWTLALPKLEQVGPYHGQVLQNRFPLVIENKSGDVLLAVMGASAFDHESSSWSSFITIYDSDGVALQTIPWGTSTESFNDDDGHTHGADYRTVYAIAGGRRFPDPA